MTKSIYATEEHFKKDLVEYLHKHNWETKEETPRADSINWEHQIRADLLIRHSFWSNLGWIGFELKLFKGGKSFTSAFCQILSKYQNNYFAEISKPIRAWIVATDTVYNPEWHNQVDNLLLARIRGIREVMSKFGVGFFCFDQLNPWIGRWYNSRYNRIDFVEGNQRFSIHLEEDAMRTYSNPKVVENFVFEHSNWKKGAGDWCEND